MKATITLILLTVFFLPGALQGQGINTGQKIPGNDGPASCEANFTYEQDTTDLLVFNFYDHSSGTISDYTWDFGDGSTGSGQVVSHAFPGIGTYKVCLTVSNSDTLSFCSDSMCVIIDLAPPQPTYLLGGLLYAGNFPINNPFNTGDFGYAYLYRLLDGEILPVDTIQFDTLGYFYFLNVPAGDYLLKAGLKQNSSNFSSYLPGYFEHFSGWIEADTLRITADYFMAHVHMAMLVDLPSGLGNIEGYVVADVPTTVRARIGNCQVTLGDSLGRPVRCTYTDGTGSFRFDYLPDGNYILTAEYTGLYSDIVQVRIDPVQPVLDNIEVVLHDSPQGIGPAGKPASFDVSIFPNPASGELNIAIRSDKVQEIQYRMINALGQTILQKDLRVQAGNSLEQAAVSGIPPGIYILRISNIQTGETVPERVLIR